jgi:hypothetical protein
MLRRLCSRLSYANVMATVGVFLGVGGGAYAASSLIGSDGQVHACVDKKGRPILVKAGTKCGKGKSAVAWNQRGVRGIRGIRGIQGVPGPGAISFDRQFDFVVGGTTLEPQAIDGFQLFAFCATTPSPKAEVGIQRIDSNHGFYAWGTKAEDGTLSHATLDSPSVITATGANSAELDVVAESTAPGETVKWTRFDLTVIKGTKCNFHGMVTSSSSAG